MQARRQGSHQDPGVGDTLWKARPDRERRHGVGSCPGSDPLEASLQAGEHYGHETGRRRGSVRRGLPAVYNHETSESSLHPRSFHQSAPG